MNNLNTSYNKQTEHYDSLNNFSDIERGIRNLLSSYFDLFIGDKLYTEECEIDSAFATYIDSYLKGKSLLDIEPEKIALWIKNSDKMKRGVSVSRNLTFSYNNGVSMVVYASDPELKYRMGIYLYSDNRIDKYFKCHSDLDFDGCVEALGYKKELVEYLCDYLKQINIEIKRTENRVQYR